MWTRGRAPNVSPWTRSPIFAIASRTEASRFAPGLAQAVLSRWWSGLATAGLFADQKIVPRHPGDCPTGQGFSLFINTLKFNRSETILAFG
jgi:hypothetical protein